jgi:hypothetical protein
MATKFKPLKDLRGSYGSNDISQLVDFTSQANINLPESGNYFFEKQGNTIHVYGTREGISEYELPEQSGAVRVTSEGIELGYKAKGVERVVLHARPYAGDLVQKTQRQTRTTGSSASGESRESGESRVSSGRSRTSDNGSRESRSGGES